MRDLIRKFSKPGEQVVDLFFGMFRAASVCLKLLQYRRFVGCKTYSECFASGTEAQVETYAKQVLNEMSDNLGIVAMVGALKIVVRALY